jgi:hypothetical protein
MWYKKNGEVVSLRRNISIEILHQAGGFPVFLLRILQNPNNKTGQIERDILQFQFYFGNNGFDARKA